MNVGIAFARENGKGMSKNGNQLTNSNLLPMRDSGLQLACSLFGDTFIDHRRNSFHETPKPPLAVLAGALLCALSWAPSASAAVIGIDGVHGFDNAAKLTGGNFDQLRQAIINQGHTLVTLNSFNAASLAGLDGAIFMTPYSQNNHSYSAAERAAIQAFASQRGVFVSDSSLWTDDGAGSDRPISFGDNQRLLENSVNFVA